MGRYALLALVLTACGRLSFDALEDASVSLDDGSSGDAATTDASLDAVPPACPVLACGAAATSMNCNGRCYTRCSELVLEPEAQSRCGTWGGTIATVHSQTDNDCVGAVAPAQSWIGYVQGSSTTLAGGWTWLDAVPSAYTNWGAGEPMDADGIENFQEQCALINPGGTWVDTGCNVTPAEITCSR